VENERFRFYNLREKTYAGFAGPRLTRKAFAEISGISVQALKAHDHNPSLRLKPITQRRLAAAQILMRAHQQTDMLDTKLVAKAEADKRRALDKLLDAAMRAGRKPLSRKSKQQAIF
jgi:hypothetical protein